MKYLRVSHWQEHYENHRTREVRHPAYYLCPSDFDNDQYLALVDHPDGAAHFGAWRAIQAVASRCDLGAVVRRIRGKPAAEVRDGRGRDGTLVRGNGEPHTATTLARKTRLPEALFEAVIPRLVELGWMEWVELELTAEALLTDDAETRGAPAAHPRQTRGASATELNGTELLKNSPLTPPLEGGGTPDVRHGMTRAERKAAERHRRLAAAAAAFRMPETIKP